MRETDFETEDEVGSVRAMFRAMMLGALLLIGIFLALGYGIYKILSHFI